MAAVITLSDSDDSDDLPPFAERVKKLIDLDVRREKRNNSPKQNISHIHAISDSDSDSRETIPFRRNRSVSPICNLLGSETNQKIGSSSNDTYDLNHRTPSPAFDLPDLSNDSESPPWNLQNLPDHYSNVEDKNVILDDDICIRDFKNHKGKNDNDIEKEQRKKIRLEKKKEKELMKVLKASEKEILKHQKPDECLKNMKIVLDHSILSLEGSQSIFNSLDENNLKHSIERNNCNYSINWYRTLINLATENDEILREEREELTDTVVIIIPNEDFLKMIHAYAQDAKDIICGLFPLEEFIVNVKSIYPECSITCVTIGFQKYLRTVKEDASFGLKTIAKQVYKNAFEEAVIELQLQTSVNFIFLDSMIELGTLLHQFTKAIAESPQRKEKENQKSLAFSWYADIDSNCPIKLSKDRSSFIKLWQQQIQQFQNVGPEVAEAIVSQYSSPRCLMKAYKRCLTTKDAENLLQDIVVRRNYGPLGTQKRIGPELSFKLYLFFTSRDGNKLLKR